MRSDSAPSRPLELKFRLDEVPPEGRAFAGALSEETLGADLPGMVGDLGYRPQGPARIEGNVYRSAKTEIVVDGRVTAEVGFDCVRCLTARVLPLDMREDHVLVRRKARAVEDGEDDQTVEQDALDEPDVETFSGDEIDLTDLFRQDLLLALPMNPSCADVGADDCRDLVAEKVATEEPQIDPRWAPLLEMKKKMT